MSLALQLKFDRTTLLWQENTTGRLVATNTGNRVIEAGFPAVSPDLPWLRVTELKTGVETVQKPHIHQSDRGTAFQELEPGQELEHEFPLNYVARFPVPGAYEVAALLPSAETGIAVSNPVHFNILPVTPRSLSLVSVQGGWAPFLFGVSVNVAADPPQIVRHSFSILSEGGVTDARAVANASLRAAPVLSSPPNQNVAHAHWIAWRDNNRIAFTHFDEELGTLPVGTWSVPQPEYELIQSLATEVNNDSAGRPPGTALIWMGNPANRLSIFQVLHFTPDGKAATGASEEAGGPKPLWMQAHVLSTGKRILTYLQQIEQDLVLFIRPWPGTGTAQPPKSLARWRGTFHSAHTQLIADDSMHGALLLRAAPAAGSPLEIMNWTISAKGEYLERPKYSIPWSYQSKVARALVRTSPAGQPAALIAAEDGPWQFFDNDSGLKDMPITLANLRLPMEIVFMGEADPVLIAGTLTGGFQVVMPDGSPLPDLCG